MERYFLEPKQQVLSDVPEDAGIEQMIAAIGTYLNSLKEALMTFDIKTVNTSNVNNLMFTAYSRFPSMHKKARRLALKELDLWDGFFSSLYQKGGKYGASDADESPG